MTRATDTTTQPTPRAGRTKPPARATAEPPGQALHRGVCGPGRRWKSGSGAWLLGPGPAIRVLARPGHRVAYSSQAGVVVVSEWAEPDSVLATYVSLMDQLMEPADPGIALSLTVGGLVVDGELIPEWQWFAEVSALNNYEDAFYTGMAEYVKEQSDLAHQAVKIRDAGLEVTHKQHLALSEPTKYIHLRNARISGSGDSHLWRGRLSDVSGWTPGPVKI